MRVPGLTTRDNEQPPEIMWIVDTPYYYQVRQTERELHNNDHLDVPWARTEMGLSSCYIKGARLLNENFGTVNSYLYKNLLKRR